ncbi:PD-(D/E)XK nuclease family protein [Pelagerythrobacter aerophilus]|uniref:PD-(D/E)XK nuclease n=1 Tax=Pelagerythrobacter aerophilus TaxID=2306995 RepID=A0A418NMW5_9SPHN|nr:PD-(D/E)XK nuclease family protein [Pelagerythrobacter aerophilus]RIV81532.1 hypothetical protein D2V04_00325 [Pelagerythrobacter aerophilus]
MKSFKANEAVGDRLSLYFADARPYLHGLRRVPQVDRLIDAESFSRFLEALRVPLRHAEESACANPWTTSCLQNDEVRNCAVLADLWDRRKHGRQAQAFLAGFFAQAGSHLPDDDELANGYTVQTEHCLNGAITDRVDITIETQSSVIGVEVKIFASERDNQLADYRTAIAARARLMGREKHEVVFLSPYRSRDEAIFVPHITWRKLADIAEQANPSTHSGWLISQFGQHCRTLGI